MSASESFRAPAGLLALSTVILVFCLRMPLRHELHVDLNVQKGFTTLTGGIGNVHMLRYKGMQENRVNPPVSPAPPGAAAGRSRLARALGRRQHGQTNTGHDISMARVVQARSRMQLTGANDACHGQGVYHPVLNECRCTAGWDGRFCSTRLERPCNREVNPRATTNRDSLCAGNCDDNRGLCYCAGLGTPFQRPLPHYCAPWAHKTTRLPDGRPVIHP